MEGMSIFSSGDTPLQTRRLDLGYHSGQALLMVVVAMVIILTVSLSVATRSVVELKTSSEEATSQQAFSAAEAGIEKYLKNSQTFTGNVGTANVTVNTVPVGGGNTRAILLNNGNPVLRDDGIDLWLSSYPGYTAPYWSGTFRAYWGSSNDCSSAALEILLITGPAAAPLSNPTITRRVYDPCAARRGTNNFPDTSTPGTVLNVSYANHIVFTIDAANPGIIMRLIPLYANTTIAVTGDSDFPQQGTLVSSTGSAGETKRKITVFQAYPKVPAEFFQYTLFSP